jgi:hypothetical protein
MRYDTTEVDDGLPPGEGAFLACSFWMADNYLLQGRVDEAQALFDRLLAYRNDVGLLAEEYDPVAKRQLGNFPQAFSHVALVHTGLNLMKHEQEMAKATGQPAHDGASQSAPSQNAPSQNAAAHNGSEIDKLDPAATPDSGAATSSVP